MNPSTISFLIGFVTAIRCRSSDPIRGDPILLCADLTS